MDKGMEYLAEMWAEEVLPILNSYDMSQADMVSIAESLIQAAEDNGAEDWESLTDDPVLYDAARSLHPDFDWDEDDEEDIDEEY